MTASARQSHTATGLLLPAGRPLRAALLVATLLASACTPASNKAAIPQVRVLAETDLDCGPDDIRIEQELGGRFLAIGCGRKARYDARCEGVKCVVTEADGPALGWRDRPDPSP